MTYQNKIITPGISVIIPCYKSENFLPKLVLGLIDVLEHLQKSENIDYEVILIIDGSPDNTFEVASQIAFNHSRVVAFELTRNFGQHAAIFAGIEKVNYNLILTMDDDGQHPPRQILKLIEAMTDEIDVVYGIARNRKHSIAREFVTKTAKFSTYKLLGIENIREISAFRLFRTELVQNFDLVNFPSAIVDVILHWNTTRFHSVRIDMDFRQSGTSNYSYRSLFRFVIKMVIGYSLRPLRLATTAGFFAFVLSIFMGIFLLISKLFGHLTLPESSSVIILITIFASFQLFTLGLIGEYIGTIYQRSIGKPSYNFRGR